MREKRAPRQMKHQRKTREKRKVTTEQKEMRQVRDEKELEKNNLFIKVSGDEEDRHFTRSFGSQSPYG